MKKYKRLSRLLSRCGSALVLLFDSAWLSLRRIDLVDIAVVFIGIGTWLIWPPASLIGVGVLLLLLALFFKRP